MAITANRFFSADPRDLTPEIEDRFFTDLKTRNNTFKRTASERFRALDDRCVAHFEAAHSTLHQVLDIGVSSGSTTLALRQRLRAAGQAPQIRGTDVSLSGYIVPIRRGLQVLVDEAGHPLQYEVLGLAIRAWRRRADYVTGMVLVLGLLRLLSKATIAARLRDGGPAVREVRLLSPRIVGQPDIRIQKNDIFRWTNAFAGRFDFIRAANILNLGYFDEAALRLAFDHVVRYLAGPGAWLLVARSSDRATAATLFRVSPDGRRLLVVDRVDGGSEVEHLVLATALPAEWAGG